MPIEFRNLYSISHFINITDKLCGRLTKTFPAATGGGGGGGGGVEYMALSPVHQAFKLSLGAKISPKCMQNAA